MSLFAQLRTSARTAIAVVGCLALLCAGASAYGAAKQPRVSKGHAAAGKRHKHKQARRHHRRHHHKHHKAAKKTAVSPAGNAAGGGNGGSSSSESGSSGSGSGSGKKGTTPTAPTKPAAPVTEAPKTPPVETPPVTTPPPETTSGPTPSQSTHCFSAPHLCGFPDSTNSGVPAGTTLTASGSIDVTKAGTVINGLNVTGTIDVLADNVTIENTKITQNTTCGTRSTCGNYAIRIDETAEGTTIRHVETASAAGDTCEHDIRNTGGTTTIEASYLHACDSNLYAVGPTTLKDSYGVAKIAISEDHIENIYFNETSFSAIHDTLLNPVGQTAVIFGNSGGGDDVTNCSNKLTVQESLIAGGGYSLYPCAHAAQAGSSSLNVQGNHFARCVTAEGYEPDGGAHPCVGGPDSSGYYPNSGDYGIAAYYFPAVSTWRGNVWDDNLGKVCLGGGSTGCE